MVKSVSVVTGVEMEVVSELISTEAPYSEK